MEQHFTVADWRPTRPWEMLDTVYDDHQVETVSLSTLEKARYS